MYGSRGFLSSVFFPTPITTLNGRHLLVRLGYPIPVTLSYYESRVGQITGGPVRNRVEDCDGS